MSAEVKSVIEKLKIVQNMAQSNETKQLCDLIIELADTLIEKGSLGFSLNEGKRIDKPKK